MAVATSLAVLTAGGRVTWWQSVEYADGRLAVTLAMVLARSAVGRDNYKIKFGEKKSVSSFILL